MIAPTWPAHCATYKPGEYGRYATRGSIERDANELTRILALALEKTERKAAA